MEDKAVVAELVDYCVDVWDVVDGEVLLVAGLMLEEVWDAVNGVGGGLVALAQLLVGMGEFGEALL